METHEKPRVEFGRDRSLPIVALIAGVIMAIGVSAVVLGLGGQLSQTMQFWLVIVAVGMGGLTALTAAFFGTVIPSSVDGRCHQCGAETARDENPSVQTQ